MPSNPTDTMDRSSLHDDDRAVTPVIGIILVVALAVILASLVTIHALGLFGVTDDAGPNVAVTFDYQPSASTGIEDSWTTTNSDGKYDGLLNFTYQHGDQKPVERFSVRVTSRTDQLQFSNSRELGSKEFYSAGDTLSIWVNETDTVRIIWDSPEGDKSTAVAVWDDG